MAAVWRARAAPRRRAAGWQPVQCWASRPCLGLGLPWAWHIALGMHTLGTRLLGSPPLHRADPRPGEVEQVPGLQCRGQPTRALGHRASRRSQVGQEQPRQAR